jgi:hypothetical protein
MEFNTGTASLDTSPAEEHLKNRETSQFLLLPREIRDHILEYILLSPTGLVRLEWSNKKHLPDTPSHGGQFEIHCTRIVGARARIHGHGGGSALRFARLREIRGRTRIDLAPLFVSRQLYKECARIIWGLNIVDLGKPRLLGRCYRGWDVSPRPYIQHVAIEYSISRVPIERYPTSSWIIPLTELRKWGSYGSLKTVDLHIIANSVYRLHEDYIDRKKKMVLYDNNNEVYFEEEIYEVWMKELRKVRADEYLSKLDIKVIANTGHNKLTRSVLLHHMYFAPFDPNLHFQELSTALGREVWVDGVLCYDDGKVLKVPFPQYYEAKQNLSMPLEVSIPLYLKSIGEKRDHGWP